MRKNKKRNIKNNWKTETSLRVKNQPTPQRGGRGKKRKQKSQKIVYIAWWGKQVKKRFFHV
jgi:hypothetical protein